MNRWKHLSKIITSPARLLLAILCSGLLGLSSNELTAQTSNLHVITKRLEKTFKYRDGYEVNIEGEKADVSIETWGREEISLTVEFVAKHPDKGTAETDIEKIKYIAERVRNKIYIRNYISVAEGEPEPASNLSARYVVKVPESCPVYLKNYFGTANVINLAKRFRYQGEFSPVGLENVQGSIDLTTRFGDISGKRLDGQVTIDSRRSNITLEEIKGRYSINTNYGDVRILSASAGLLDLNITGTKSDIFLFDPKLLDYSYALTAQHGSIYFPSNLKMEFLKNTEDIKKVEFQPRAEYYPSVTISVTFGDIYLEKEKTDRR
ncbi:MAG: hypothetical protein RIC19_11745 [Phaeodactylibacter sp.]|uniref:hypothetical protein n=1 Tax=Phaeodactylibacter sp. TaxID=1940289 RepID=UPI0032EEE804